MSTLPHILPTLAAASPVEHVLPHDLLHPFGFPITNQMIMALIAALIMLLFIPAFRRPDASAPRGARNFLEAILEFLRVEVFRPALKENTDRFLPFLWTLFFYILICNLIGDIPFAEIITALSGGHPSHFGGTPTGNIAVTGALAVVVFVLTHVSGIVQVFHDLRNGTYGHHGHHEEHSSDGNPGHEAAVDLDHMRAEALPADIPGNFKAVGNPTKHYADDEHRGQSLPHALASNHANPGNPGNHHNPAAKSAPVAALLAVPLYIWNFAPHPFKPAPGANPLMWIADVLMWAFLLLLEFIGALIKPFALTVRLFANMIAGHIVIAVMVGLIPLTAGIGAQLALGIPVTVVSVLLYILEIFVAFLQAYIFVFLATLFIASAVAPEH